MKLNTDYLKRVAVAALLSVVSVALVAYVSYHLWRSLSQSVKTVTAVKSDVAVTVKATGYIMRDETVLSSAASGNTVAVADYGEKVGINDVVVQVYGSGTAETADRIKEIDGEIELLNDCLVDGTLSMYDSSSLDADIISLMKAMRAADADGDYVTADSVRMQLKKKLIRRNVMSSDVDKVKNMVDDLTSERNSLMASLGYCLAEVKAPMSGYFYDTADGYEASFTADAAMSMTYAQFCTLISTDASAPETSCGKIAGSFVWYLACIVSPDETGKIEEGTKRTVSFPQSSGASIVMTVERVVNDKDTKTALVVFSSDIMPDGFDFSRSQPIEILKEEFTCIKVPLSAIRVIEIQIKDEADGTVTGTKLISGVYVLDGSTVYFRQVSVIQQNEDVYLVETEPEGEAEKGFRWLSRNDNIIVEGKGLYHGRILS